MVGADLGVIADETRGSTKFNRSVDGQEVVPMTALTKHVRQDVRHDRCRVCLPLRHTHSAEDAAEPGLKWSHQPRGPEQPEAGVLSRQRARRLFQGLLETGEPIDRKLPVRGPKVAGRSEGDGAPAHITQMSTCRRNRAKCSNVLRDNRY